MSFLGRLFGGKAAAPSPAPTAAPAPTDPSKDPNMIRVHDAYGRELFMTKQAWRDSVLLDHIKKVWSDPDALYSTIVQSIEDGFTSDMVKPAEQLAKIDPNAERGAVLLAVVHLQLKRFDDAERVLRRHLEHHAESGMVFTNLAKVHAGRGESDRVEPTLWHGLELDPNQENGLGWYEVLHREKDGPAAGLAALRRIAALPQSWRARLWLARDALVRRRLEEALALYDEALSTAPRPVPTDLLMQLSGDLGNHGHLPEILRLAAPLFDVTQHGIRVGNNLIKANLDLGRLDAAHALLDLHYAQKRPDWKETLAFWDTELAKARVAVSSAPTPEKLSIAMLVGDGPIWLPSGSAAAELFPAPADDPIKVAFLGSTAATAAAGSTPVHQMSDAPGRMSRALPLFLAEQVRFGGDAAVRTIVPWLKGERPAFVLCGVPWNDDEAAQHGRSGEPPYDYVIVTHLDARNEPWRAELRLIRTIDAKCLGTSAVALNVLQPETACLELANDALQLLVQNAGLTRSAPPHAYRTPAGPHFAPYLLRLEQLLAVRCNGMEDGNASSSLNGEREIVDGCIHLCVEYPTSLVTRILLAQVLRWMKKIRPQVVAEASEKARLLENEKPLSSPAHEVIQQMLQEALA